MATDPRRSYPIHQCRLFRTTSPADLAHRLDLKTTDLEALVSRTDNYKRFKVGRGKKRRDVEEPKAQLQHLHKKIARWLARVETPDYLHSAIKRRSYISNAAAHSAHDNLIKVDVRSFFRNVTRQAVFHFFVDTMRCRGDVAMILAKMLTVDGHLPTGSSASPILSYYAHKRMFDEIAACADQRNLTFTVYIDDMCLSGSAASRKALFEVRGIIASHGLKSHKCRFFPAGVPRVVTGVALTTDGRRLPHRRHLKISQAFEELGNLAEGPLLRMAANALSSRMHEAAQIEPIWRERARSFEKQQKP